MIRQHSRVGHTALSRGLPLIFAKKSDFFALRTAMLALEYRTSRLAWLFYQEKRFGPRSKIEDGATNRETLEASCVL